MTKVKIKEGWSEAGKEGIVLEENIFASQSWWTPVLWDGEEDPDFHKTDGLIFTKF